MPAKVLKKAVALIRVSTDNQAKTNDSIDGQLRSIKKWAQENDVTIEKFYHEQANSAFRGKRPILDKILFEIEDGIVNPDAIIVYAFSRFTRKATTTAKFKNALLKRDIPVLSVTEPMPEDEDSAFISQTVIDMVNELQSRTNSKVVQDRLNDTANKGYFTGGNIPFGYASEPINIPNTKIIKKKLVVNPDEALTIRKIFNYADVGVSGKPLGVFEIAKKLNQANEKPRGKPWTKNKINRILNNSIYYGDFEWGKNRVSRSKSNPPIIIKVPAIIEKAQFDRVRAGLLSRKPFSKSNEPINTLSKGKRSGSLLVGLLKCSFCGSNLTVMHGKTIKRVNGVAERYQYYRCPNRTRSNCPCPNIRRDVLDKAIIETFLVNVLNSNFLKSIVLEIKDKISDVIKGDESTLLGLHKNQAELKLQINNLYDRIANGVIELDDILKENLEQKKRSLGSITNSIEQIRARTKLPLKKFGTKQIEAFVQAAQDVLTNQSNESAKQLLLLLVSNILIYKEKLIISGVKFNLAEIISKTKMGTSNEVPMFVSIWRRERDSNPR